jgi:hypothetical protein
MVRYIWLVSLVLLSACSAPPSAHTPATPYATAETIALTDPKDTPVDAVGYTPTPVTVSDESAGAPPASASATAGVTDTPIVVTATPTPILMAPQVATGWRFQQADMPGAVFMFAGVHCATNGADVSGEWLIEANPVIEGVPFTGRYVVVVNPDQQTGTWQYQQFFAVNDVKSVARVAGQIAAVRIGADGSVTFDLRVAGGIEGVLITPDGEFPLEYPYPVTTLTNFTWVPMMDACP